MAERYIGESPFDQPDANESWEELGKRQFAEFTQTTQRYRYALQKIAQLRQSDNPASDLLREADKIAREALDG